MQHKVCLLKKALIFSAFFVLFPGRIVAAVCPPQHIDAAARVNYVYDGDTLRLEDGRKIRLMGIDTPEIFSKRQSVPEKIAAQGELARRALQQQLKRSANRVSLSYGVQRFDRYGRTLAHVFLPDGTNLQAWLIAHGHAIAFTTPPNERMSDCYQQQETKARQSGLGIWTMPEYQLKNTGQLNRDSRGFFRLQGKVTRIWNNKAGVALLLDDRVRINIYRNDLLNFNAHMLNNLQAKKIKVRGWLHLEKSTAEHARDIAQQTYAKTMHYMTLRHPDALKVID